jgi:8-oxo-dGTP diphosphatase
LLKCLKKMRRMNYHQLNSNTVTAAQYPANSISYSTILNYSFVVLTITLLVISLIALITTNSSLSYSFNPDKTPKCPYIFHGGSPSHKGSCWCSGIDEYCLCTPSLAIDAIIEYNPDNIVTAPSAVSQHHQKCDNCKIILVFRRDPPKEVFAIPGGFVNIGETTEDATIREAKEETNLTLSLSNLEQFHFYSDPHRDKRRHTVSMVYRCLVNNIQDLKNGDDAKAVKAIPLSEILSLSLAFDHKTVLTDYLKRYHPLAYH